MDISAFKTQVQYLLYIFGWIVYPLSSLSFFLKLRFLKNTCIRLAEKIVEFCIIYQTQTMWDFSIHTREHTLQEKRNETSSSLITSYGTITGIFPGKIIPSELSSAMGCRKAGYKTSQVEPWDIRLRWMGWKWLPLNLSWTSASIKDTA